MDVQNFIRERDEALLSLDRQQIQAYCEKYGAKLPSSEKAFWGGVHKAICTLSSATPTQKKNSKRWLIEHGFQPKIQ